MPFGILYKYFNLILGRFNKLNENVLSSWHHRKSLLLCSVKATAGKFMARPISLATF